jgi:hypothetical protein
LPHKAGPPVDIGLANFELHDDDRNVIASGDLATPDFIQLDTTQKPTLIISFNTEGRRDQLARAVAEVSPDVGAIDAPR